VIDVANLLARIHVDQHGHRWIRSCGQGSGPDQQEDGGTPGPLTSRRPWELSPGSSSKIHCERSRSYSDA
jgi:hypothetical protein